MFLTWKWLKKEWKTILNNTLYLNKGAIDQLKFSGRQIILTGIDTYFTGAVSISILPAPN
jgi:hypothetical protein